MVGSSARRRTVEDGPILGGWSKIVATLAGRVAYLRFLYGRLPRFFAFRPPSQGPSRRPRKVVGNKTAGRETRGSKVASRVSESRIMGPMSDRDPAFLWETEALRSAAQRTAPPVVRPTAHRTSTTTSPAGQWRTLREAHLATGIPVDTLRKWVRRGAVSSFLDLRDGDPRRMVDMDAVYARARELGRVVRILPDPGASIEPAATTATSADPPQEPVRAATPPGTMIVPIAAWDKMLMQLGNLHEAGQQLAEARERAARAETESVFLRERLGELRREIAHAADEALVEKEAALADRTTADTPSEHGPLAGQHSWRDVSRKVFATWRARRKG